MTDRYFEYIRDGLGRLIHIKEVKLEDFDPKTWEIFLQNVQTHTPVPN